MTINTARLKTEEAEKVTVETIRGEVRNDEKSRKGVSGEILDGVGEMKKIEKRKFMEPKGNW